MSAGPHPHFAELPKVIALAVFALVASLPPAMVWLMGAQSASDALESEARMLTTMVSQFAGRHPETWRYNPDRLTFAVRDIMPQQRRVTVRDMEGEEVLSLGSAPARPSLESSQPVRERELKVGTLTLEVSMLPVLEDVMWAALVSVAVALAGSILLWKKALLFTRLAALEVEEGRERFRRLTELSNDGYWTMDRDLRFTSLSVGMERIGLGTAAVACRSVSDLPFAPESPCADFAAVLARRERFFNVAVCLEQDGQMKWLAVSGEPVFGQAGEFLGFHGTATDVTERQRMQEALLQSEKLASVGELAAGMAHEINNPLGGILQSIQVIERRMDPSLPANQAAAGRAGCPMGGVRNYLEDREISQMLDNIAVASRKAAGIVTAMLDFSRKSPSGRQRLNLLDALESALELSKRYCLEGLGDLPPPELSREYRETFLPVLGIGRELEQVLVNVMNNAFQAMREKSYVETRPRLVLRAYRTHGEAVVEIEDNGPGMDDAVRKRIFDPFFTTKPPGQGTGLGLSVSYYIITRNHGGSMDLASSPGKGTTFTIRLPLDEGRQD